MKKISLLVLVVLSLSNAVLASELGSILFVGDSHSYGRFGIVLEQRLSKLATRVVMESSCGSTPSTWLGATGYEKTVCGFWRKDGIEEIRTINHQTPKFGEELNAIHPDLVIIELGTNIAAASLPLRASKSVETMMKMIAAARAECIWIGPPDANSKIVTKEKLKVTSEMIASLSKTYNCQYIDSLTLTSFPENEKEGIHYPPNLSAIWANKIDLEITKILSKH